MTDETLQNNKALSETERATQAPLSEPAKEPKETLRGRIVTGMPLSVAAQKRIAKRFKELTGAEVRLSCRLDKKQIAGIKVELNGVCYDGTLKGQLADVQRLLVGGGKEKL